MTQDTHTAPQPAFAPTISATEERHIGTIAHIVPMIAMVLSAGTLGFVGSLVIYLIYRDKGPFVRQHAVNSLNVQLTMLVALIVSVPLMLVLVGFVTFPLAFVVAFVYHVIGAVKANNGEWWNPPAIFRFVH